jgi:hypothetical protein
MTTFNDDFIRLEFTVFKGGELKHVMKHFLCKENNIDWPPPEKFVWNGIVFVREAMSTLTDEQRSDMTHVCRGALYKPDKSVTSATPY